MACGRQLGVVALVAAGLAAGTTACEAQDRRADVRASAIQFSPAIDWTGFSAAVFGGFGSGRVGRGDLFTLPAAPQGFRPNFTAPLSPDILAGSSTVSGAGFGAAFGFQRQYGMVVLGGEADLMLTSLRARASGQSSYAATAASGCPFVAIGGGSLCTQAATVFSVTENQTLHLNQSWLATARARLGVTFGSTLVYGTGGLALSSISTRLESTTAAGGQGGSATTTAFSPRVGYAVGLGVEHMLASNFGVRGEWLHYGLGSISLTSPQLTQRMSVDGHLFRAGVFLRY